MATYAQGVNGAFRGKAGSVVGSNWRSIGYLRGLARFKSKSNSPKQAAQRARFGMAVSFLRPMKNVLNLGFRDKKSNKSTGYNQGMQRFMKNAIIGEYPDLQINYSGIEVSSGGLGKLLGLSASSNTPNTVSMSWMDNSLLSGDTHGDDEVIVLLYDETEDTFATFKNVLRQDEAAELELPALFSGHTIHVYAFAMDRDGLDASNSQYAGEITLA
ncbi:hypothetical protein GCM10023231_01200 [Olivibacter ginsenosidimutans]|uniref:Capsid protein n=2 Tax=Olivibacter ginsenosidimutans TaxID=1176537 RepID=A0ABP9ACV7_9SPHI